MQPHDAYRAQEHAGWTRIELLLALYQGTLDRLQRAADAWQCNDALTSYRQRMRCLRMVCELRAGLDVRYGQLPRRIDQLLEFVQYCLLADPPDFQAAGRILDTLHSAFAGIREEAIELEARGEIPPVKSEAPVVRRA